MGRLPVARGTWGSLATLPLCWLAAQPGSLWLYLGTVVAVTATAFPAAAVAERVLGEKDPGAVVIDESAGMLLTLFAVPLGVGPWAAGFFLFRFFDVCKVFPANRLERLRGGVGIVADDLVAGLYANLTLQAGLRLWAAFH